MSLKSFLLGKQFIGIEHFSSANEEKVAVLHIGKKKDSLTITQGECFNFPYEKPHKWDKNLPVCLIVNTDQIIHKEIQETNGSDEKLLHKAFPNVAASEFYYEIWRSNDKSIIAIGRKNYIDALVAEYKKNALDVTSVNLGIIPLSSTVGFLTQRTFFTNTQEISPKETPMISKKPLIHAVYDINGLEIENTFLLSFSGILRLFIPEKDVSGNLSVTNDSLRDSFNQKQFFSKTFRIAIGLLLFALLVNFFAFNYYFQKDQHVSENLAAGLSQTKLVEKAKERIKVKTERLQNIAGLNSSKSALIINEIANRVPSSILLSSLAYNPIKKKVKPDEPLLFEEKVILISGVTVDNPALTKWIDVIDNLKNIENVIILNYGKSELNETVFTIKIQLK